MHFPVKWEGISFLNNMKFSADMIRVWRAYSIGAMKLKLWKDFNMPKDYVPPTLKDPHEVSIHTTSVSFTNITTRRESKKNSAVKQLDTAEDEITDNDTPSLKSFHRHSSLQNHLDCGKHKYALECETLFDKAITMYASKLEQGATCKGRCTADI